MFRRNMIVCTMAAIFAIGSSAHAGKKVQLGSKVDPAKQISMDAIDHQPWDAILRTYVDEDGMVNYRALKASTKDSQRLDAYLDSLSFASMTIPAKREATLAYWINAYNAVTVQGMLREYPTSSIRNHTAKLYGYNIWHDLQLITGGKPHSLDDIEHKILRKTNEPRIHFAIVCASIGCPRLLNQAYTADRLEEQLETNARDFFSREQNFRYDGTTRKFYLSSILNWFGEDFGSDQSAQLKRIAGWLPTAEATQAAQQKAVSVKFLDYNWNINEQKTAR